MTRPYPLVFEPILMEKVWGGRRLARYGKSLTPGTNYGESWELADLAATSVSGGGGGSAVSIIACGPLAGRHIGDAIGLWGADLLGEHGLARARELGETTGAGRPVFPLLVKYLDAREHLSVQVHPSPSYARAHPGSHLKTESWFVVEAERAEMPGGGWVEPQVFKGLVPGVSADSFRAHIESGTVAGDLHAERAEPGVCHTLPSGTVHALGAGVLVAEVQTPSDTTFRVYDWTAEYDRPERELHVEQALACIDFDDAPPEGIDTGRGGRAAATAYYTMDSVLGPVELGGDTPRVVMVYAGEGIMNTGGEPTPVSAGTTVLVPASIAGRFRIEGGPGLRSIVVGLSG